ncbi:hypothetical protein OPT61_g2736 [Boeremia exigua]|uniref:Uncharacterized protein n=1 Tax=Boeremia exigua TaxID=749465 RepID=A0ACC2IKL8_9PLEO|nr:hypothetical protein OPT61_g2736 [Boeremia exigua]
MILPLLTTAFAAQIASARVILRHEGHAEAPSFDTKNATDVVYPTSTTDSSYDSTTSMPCNMTTHIDMTATAIRPSQNSIGSHAPYPNATSKNWGSYVSTSLESSSPYPPTSSIRVSTQLTTAHWDELWSLHWPTSQVSDNSVPTASTPVYASNPSALASSMAAPSVASTPTPSNEQPSTTFFVPSAATMSASLSSVAPSPNIPNAFVDPIIFDPGRLSSANALTSTLRITITASAAIPSSTTAKSSLDDLIISSKVTSTLTKTLRQSSPSSDLVSSTTSSKLASTSSSSTIQSNAPAVHTSVISANPRCPYPFPGVYCGEPKTTLITETRSGASSTTSVQTSESVDTRPKESGWCPYPGLKC